MPGKPLLPRALSLTLPKPLRNTIQAGRGRTTKLPLPTKEKTHIEIMWVFFFYFVLFINRKLGVIRQIRCSVKGKDEGWWRDGDWSGLLGKDGTWFPHHT